MDLQEFRKRLILPAPRPAEWMTSGGFAILSWAYLTRAALWALSPWRSASESVTYKEMGTTGKKQAERRPISRPSGCRSPPALDPVEHRRPRGDHDWWARKVNWLGFAVTTSAILPRAVGAPMRRWISRAPPYLRCFCASHHDLTEHVNPNETVRIRAPHVRPQPV